MAARRTAPTGAVCACSSPPAARASRSTACATSATAPRGAWAWRWPRPRARAARDVTLVAANVALPSSPGSCACRVTHGGRAEAGLPSGVPALRRAADGGRRRRLRARQRRARARSRRPGATGSSWSSRPTATCWRGCPRSAAPARRWSASRPSTARRRLELGTRQARREGPRRDRRQRHLAQRHRLRRGRERGDDPHGPTATATRRDRTIPRAPKEQVAEEILDAVWSAARAAR